MEADVQPAHTTVLLHEAVDALLGDGVGPLACFVDATYGRGGHSALLLQRLHLAQQLRLYQIPLRHLTVTFKFRSHRASTVADLSHSIAQFRIFKHLFNVSQLV